MPQEKNPVGRPPKFKCVEDVEIAIEAFFQECDTGKDGVSAPYTMSGLAYALGCDRKTLLNYSKKDDYFPTIKKARERVELDVERRLMSGHSVAGAIFNLKNNFGWKDKTEVEQHNYNHESALDELE